MLESSNLLAACRPGKPKKGARNPGSLLVGRASVSRIASMNRILATLAAMLPMMALAMGPHELLLVVNRDSEDSKAIAADYADLRGIPAVNVVEISIPGKADPAATIGREEFEKFIWSPVIRAVQERSLGHVLAWAYSAGFPIRVDTGEYDCSLTGLTFARNRAPPPDEIRSGTFRSLLFAGPNMPDRQAYAAQSFDRGAALHGEQMPLPAMMLGSVMKRANTVDEISRYLANGVRADHTAPSGTVYYVTSQDVRARARAWQFAGAQAALAEMGVKSVVTDAFPSGKAGVAGVMMGTATLPALDRTAYAAGCLSDHFTSWAGAFDHTGQSKVSEWLSEGIVGSAGTVVEPYAIWMKFPNAWLYVHYAAGCTAIESYYQSVSSPLQLLIVGDPLAQPWAPRARVALGNIVPAEEAGRYEVQAVVAAPETRRYRRFMFLVDGRAVTGIDRSAVLTFDASELDDGPHALRAVAYRTGSVRSQAFDEVRFEVRDGRILQ